MTWPKPGTVIGVLQNGRHRGIVRVAGEPQLGEDGMGAASVSLEAPGEVGTYSGSVDLALAGDEAAPVKLKVETSDGAQWAVAAVLVGLGLAVLLTWLLQKGFVRWGLRRRRLELDDEYEAAKARFDKEFSGAAFKDYSIDSENVTQYQATLKEATKRWAKDNVLVDRDRDDFKTLVRSIQEAEADAAFFGDGFGKAMSELVAKRDEFEKAFPETTPAFLAHIKERLKGKPLPVGGATTLGSKAEEYVALIEVWSAQARLLKRLTAWIKSLQGVRLSVTDKRRVADAEDSVEVARRQMLDAASAADLESAQLARRLSEVNAALAIVGARHRIWIPTEADVEKDPFDPAARLAGRPAEAGAFVPLAEIAGYVICIAEKIERTWSGSWCLRWRLLLPCLLRYRRRSATKRSGPGRTTWSHSASPASPRPPRRGSLNTPRMLRRRERG